MAPQASQSGASDWKSANCSLRAVLGPASLGMMPARANRAALTSFVAPFALPPAWPLPFVLPLEWPLVWPFLAGAVNIAVEPPAEPGADGDCVVPDLATALVSEGFFCPPGAGFLPAATGLE